MESEKSLNKALSDMYSDLKELKSAREQVEIVTDSNKNMIKSTSALLKELKVFSAKSEEESKMNIHRLTQSLEEFENKINLISENYNSLAAEYIKTFRTKLITVLENFETTTKELKINSEKGISDVKNNSIEEISKTIQYIVDTNFKTEKLIEKITNYDIPNNLDSINNKLAIQNKQNNLIKILLLIILATLGIGGIVLKFL